MFVCVRGCVSCLRTCGQPELGIEIKKKPMSIGEELEGHDLTESGYDLRFGQDVTPTKLCSQTLNKASSEVGWALRAVWLLERGCLARQRPPSNA